MGISNKEFITILNEKNKYERMKHNLKNENENKKQKNHKIEQYKIKNQVPSKKFFFFLVYIKILEITKETQEKCGIKTIEYYHKKEDIIELWQKMSDAEGQISHSNIANAALKRIRKYCGKKTKDITEEEKEKYKAFFEGETGIFIIEKLTRDIIEHSKLPKAIELKKNQDIITAI